MRSLTSETGEAWRQHVSHITFHLNQSIHSKFGVSSFFLLHSFEARQVLDNVLQTKSENPSLNQIQMILMATRKMAEPTFYCGFEVDRGRLLKKEKSIKIWKSEKALVLSVAYGKNISKIFTNRFSIPATLLDMINPNTYLIQYTNYKRVK